MSFVALFIKRYVRVWSRWLPLELVRKTAWTKYLDAAVDDVLKSLLQNSKVLASTSQELDRPSWAHIFFTIGLVSMKVMPKYSHYCWAGWTIQGKHRMLASSLQTFQKDDAQSPLGSGWVRLIHWCDTKMVKKELRCSTSKFAALSFWWLCILVILGKHWMPDTHAVTFSKDNETNSPRVWRRLDTFKTHIGKCCLCQAGRFVWHAAFRAHFCSQDVSRIHLSFPKQNPKKT